MRSVLLGLDFASRFGLLLLHHCLVFRWVRYVVAPARVGLPRVLRFLVVLPLVLSAGYLFHPTDPAEFAWTLYAASNCAWLTGMKIWAFCFNRGQLMKSYDTRKNAAFAASLLLPITLAFHERPLAKEKNHGRNEGRTDYAYRDAQFDLPQLPWKSSLVEAGKLLGYTCLKVRSTFSFRDMKRWEGQVVAMSVLREAEERVHMAGHLFLRDVCLGWFLYSLSSLVEDVLALIVLLGWRIQIQPNFDHPWLSQSMTELWSRRYNIAVGTVLRDAIYEPVCEGRWMRGPEYFQRAKPSALRKITALATTFFASGVFHGLLAIQAFDIAFPYLQASFFVVISWVVVAEYVIHSLLEKTGWHAAVRWIPPVVYQLYTALTLFYLSHLLYWPDAIACGLPEKMVRGTGRH